MWVVTEEQEQYILFYLQAGKPHKYKWGHLPSASSGRTVLREQFVTVSWPYLFYHDKKNWDTNTALYQPRMSLDLTSSNWCPEDCAIPPHALPSTPPRNMFCQRLEVMSGIDIPCLYMLVFFWVKQLSFSLKQLEVLAKCSLQNGVCWGTLFINLFAICCLLRYALPKFHTFSELDHRFLFYLVYCLCKVPSFKICKLMF